jgi:hypothetical protein
MREPEYKLLAIWLILWMWPILLGAVLTFLAMKDMMNV